MGKRAVSAADGRGRPRGVGERELRTAHPTPASGEEARSKCHGRVERELHDLAEQRPKGVDPTRRVASVLRLCFGSGRGWRRLVAASAGWRGALARADRQLRHRRPRLVGPSRVPTPGERSKGYRHASARGTYAHVPQGRSRYMPFDPKCPQEMRLTQECKRKPIPSNPQSRSPFVWRPFGNCPFVWGIFCYHGC